MKRIYTYMCLLLLSVLSFVVTGCDDDDGILFNGNTYRAE